MRGEGGLCAGAEQERVRETCMPAHLTPNTRARSAADGEAEPRRPKARRRLNGPVHVHVPRDGTADPLSEASMRASVAKVKTAEAKLKMVTQQLRDAETQLTASKKLAEKLDEVKELRANAKLQATLLVEHVDEASQRSEEALLHEKAKKLAQEQAKLAKQRKQETEKTLARAEAQERAATSAALRLWRAGNRDAIDDADASDDENFITNSVDGGWRWGGDESDIYD